MKYRYMRKIYRQKRRASRRHSRKCHLSIRRHKRRNFSLKRKIHRRIRRVYRKRKFSAKNYKKLFHKMKALKLKRRSFAIKLRLAAKKNVL